MITSIKRFSVPRGFKLVGYDETGAATVLRKTCTTPYVLAAEHQGFDYGPETYKDAKGRSMYVAHKNDAKNSWTFHRSLTAKVTQGDHDQIVRTLPIQDGNVAAPAEATGQEAA